MVYLLECLQKTPPPVLIFCENNAAVCKEARQRIPPVLAELNDPMEFGVVRTVTNAADGCAYCGGLGHRISTCPKLEQQRSRQIASLRSRDYFGSGGYRGEM
ncbi:unnamed protein product [Linum tenue]|uniref:CCHC-type domain-containing protein n=1 Tax=Linum tenue TaxID=586396 RepID=A0AAV0HH69_9ROSI|nr:unnamed protein product [Linum tenue]